MKIECGNCGSTYDLSYNKIAMKDKDSIECYVCGENLHSWNEAKIWTAKLIEKHENHKPKFDNDGFTDEGVGNPCLNLHIVTQINSANG